ncbi:MAG: hypothetical protein Q9217_000953 [Psora testacea]
MGQFWNMQGLPNGELYRTWLEEVPNDGIIRYLDLFNSERLLIVSPKALAELLVHKTYEFIKPPHLVTGLGRILGVGVFLAEGDEHKRQRKDLMPAFAFRHIKEMYPTFWDKATELVQSIIETNFEAVFGHGEGPIVEISDWANRATLDIIGTAGLGRDFESLKNPDNYLIQTYKRLFSPSRSGQILGLLSFFFPSWLIRALPIKQNDNMEVASNVIQSTCFDLIQEKKHLLEKSDTKRDILSVAIQSGGFSDKDLVNQLMTFLIAGHETTASALSWTICMLCRHPEVQARLQEEVRLALPDPRNPKSLISASVIDNLTYLNAVCNEALRLYPPIPITIRVAACDTTLMGHFIPKNTTIFLSPWAVNTSKALWGDDAAEFNPDRWLGEGKANGSAGSNYANLTFLHGPRSCIGQNFAKGELACLVAAWARTFNTTFAKEDYVVEVRNGIAARPKDLRVKLELLKIP